MPHSRTRRRLTGLAAAVVTAAALVTASPAWAAEGSIDHVETKNGQLQVLYSLPDVGDATPDLDTLEVTLEGEPLEADATLASDATNSVRRTAILAIDVSNSMRRNGKFTEAKRAAQIFLDAAPDDLYVGIVTFAGDVTVAQSPSLDRLASKQVVDSLTLAQGTVLYDGLDKAVATSGRDGQRSIIVLSDGRDVSDTKPGPVIQKIKKAEVKVDVVALAQSTEAANTFLKPLSDAGGGAVISAKDPKALAQVFADEAQTLAKQIQITASSGSEDTQEGTLSVSVDAGGETYSDAAFVTLSAAPPAKQAGPSTDLAAAPDGFSLPRPVMVGGLIALGLGVLVLIIGMFGGFGKPKESVESRIDVYTRKGRGKRAAVTQAPAPSQGVAAQAVGMATKALESNRGFEVKLGDRLEGAGVALKPAEWLLIHAGIAMGSAAVVFALTGGNILLGLGGLVGGVVLPWAWLGIKRSRRLKAFNSQLAGCLQLMAGSMQAGLSLAQALDTVVREGQEPLSGEFRRALVETRLGVPIEDALESIGTRMESGDFEWTVMAIRIQREVGGNLAELLLNVAATLREREYLRRQVKALSAEGRFSAYILLALPPGIMVYMSMTNASYLSPLFHTTLGYMMLGTMVVLMLLGAFMMKKMIKVEV